MRKPVLALTVVLMLAASSCGQDEPAVTEPEDEQEESPTLGTFQLQGRILETLGSTEGSPTASPTATSTATPTASPTATSTATPTASPTATPTGAQPERAVIERGAPGSMSIRLSSYSAEGTSCTFQNGDTVVVALTRATNFTPSDLRENERFPRNLREVNVNVQGKVVNEENCILAADSVATQIQGQASPTPTGTAGQQSPTATASPSPTRSPQS